MTWAMRAVIICTAGTPGNQMAPSPQQQVGDELTATVEVERASGRKLSFNTAVKNAAGKVLVSGNALALLRA